jgi:hypothetical protein
VWSETFSDWSEALSRERQVKGWSRLKKIALIEGNWKEIQRLARLRKQGPKAESPRRGSRSAAKESRGPGRPFDFAQGRLFDRLRMRISFLAKEIPQLNLTKSMT